MVSRVGEVRIGARLIIAFLLLGLPLLFMVHERWFDPKRFYVDQGITGPYAANENGTTNTGRTRYTSGDALPFVIEGQRFTWQSSLCLRTGVFMLAEPQQVRLRDRKVYPGPHVLWTPEDHRCGPITGEALAPMLEREDGEVGRFMVDRQGKLRPTSWWPLDAALTALAYEVHRAPGPEPPAPAAEPLSSVQEGMAGPPKN